MSLFPSFENIITCFDNENNQTSYILCWKKENSSPWHPFISGVLSNRNWEEFAVGRFPINLIKIGFYFFFYDNAYSVSTIRQAPQILQRAWQFKLDKKAEQQKWKPFNASWKRHHLTGRCSKRTVCSIIADRCSKLGGKCSSQHHWSELTVLVLSTIKS